MVVGGHQRSSVKMAGTSPLAFLKFLVRSVQAQIELNCLYRLEL